jgi:hypothetical protein
MGMACLRIKGSSRSTLWGLGDVVVKALRY